MNAVREVLQKRWWGPVLAIYASARLFSFFAFLFFASIQEANYWTGAHPGYFDFLNIWDVEWFHKIYSHGYPVPLPTNPDGSVQNNEWAFYPAFPYLVKFINAVTAIDWKYLAPIVATIFGFAFIMVAYKLLRLKLSEKATLWGLAIVSFAWASPILQVGYAESMSLFFMTLALYAFVQRRDWLVLVSLTVAALTRPGVLAFAMMFGILAILHRGEIRERLRLLGLALVSGVLGLLWLFIAGAATGVWNAYLQTENSWRAGFTGKANIMPFMGWFESGKFFIGDGVGQAFFGCLAALFVWIFTRKITRSMGEAVFIWSISYMTYIFAVFFPQSSSPRILLPAFPLLVALGAATANASKGVKALILGVSMAGQLAWMLVCWKYTAPDYTPP